MQKENEPSLFVSKAALNTYSELTGFKPSSVFDFEGATEHWNNQKNRERILEIEF